MGTLNKDLCKIFFRMRNVYTEDLDKIKTHILRSCVTSGTNIIMEHGYQLRPHWKTTQGLELTTDPYTIIAFTLDMVLIWVPLYVQM
jgi:hypothetical protein